MNSLVETFFAGLLRSTRIERLTSVSVLRKATKISTAMKYEERCG